MECLPVEFRATWAPDNVDDRISAGVKSISRGLAGLPTKPFLGYALHQGARAAYVTIPEHVVQYVKDADSRLVDF